MFQCTETGGIYIGSSINLYERFCDHFNDTGSNIRLQYATNKYGWDHFIYRIIETCPSSELIAREQSYLDFLFNNFPKELVYNFCAIAYSTLGYIHIAETKAAIGAANSQALLGNTNRVGTTHTEGTKEVLQ